MERIEKSYNRSGFIGSLIFHAVLLAIFFFFVLKTPDPPMSDGGSGIELNYGTYEEGFGDLQTLNPASPVSNPDPTVNIEETPEVIKEVSPAVVPEPEPTPAPVVQEKEMLTSDDPEDANIEVKKVEKLLEEKVTATKPIKTEKPVVPETKPEKIEKAVVQETSQPKQEKHSENDPKTSSSPTAVSGTHENSGGNNNGDRVGKVGDQGNPGGSLNAKALYGNLGEGGDGSGGAGGGSKLDMTGWKLAFKIEKKDVTNENGKIVYQIKVDDKGELVSIIPIEKTVSPAVEKFYREQIEENWAVDRTKDNTNPPPLATGKYTVFVRSK